MVPGAQKLALAVTWAAEQAPATDHAARSSGSPRLNREASSTSHGDSESESGGAPFDTVLARRVPRTSTLTHSLDFDT